MNENNVTDLKGKTVVVGMSGGVDSAVSAVLLKEAGANVIGMFMKNWEEVDDDGNCMAEVDYNDVIAVCDKLDIPYYTVNFVKEYQENVFKHFVDEYKAGHTPNPDILCNREIKFKLLLEKALELGADYLATGHYANKVKIDGVHHLARATDKNKDQTYFLYTIKSEILDKVLFPIAEIEKSRVREIARSYDLKVKDKKDSTGICFIGERNFKKFLSNYIQSTKGEFQYLNGEVVGTHDGYCFYTIGQRKGLGLGGPGEPWFVVGKDIEKNIVYVERGEHAALYASSLTASDLDWVCGPFTESTPYKCTAKIRYRQDDVECSIDSIESGIAKVTFKVPQRAIASRQSIVFYQGNICLGGGIIE